MELRNASIFARWAVAGAIAGIGLVGVDYAVGQSARNAPAISGPSLKFAGLLVHGNFVADEMPKLRLSVDIQNPESDTRKLDLTVKLVRREFKGSMVARVFRPEDYKNTVLETRRMAVSVGGKENRKLKVLFKTVASDNPDPDISTVAIVEIGGKDQTVAAVPPSTSFAVTKAR